MDAKRLRAYLTGLGVYPTELGIECVREPGERALIEAVLQRALSLLSDGDLFCLYVLAGILTSGRSEGATVGTITIGETVALEMALKSL